MSVAESRNQWRYAAAADNAVLGWPRPQLLATTTCLRVETWTNAVRTISRWRQSSDVPSEADRRCRRNVNTVKRFASTTIPPLMKSCRCVRRVCTACQCATFVYHVTVARTPVWSPTNDVLYVRIPITAWNTRLTTVLPEITNPATRPFWIFHRATKRPRMSGKYL